MCGLDSPFGIIGHLKRECHLSHREILWREPWIRLLLEQADAPYYSPDGRDDTPTPIIDDDTSALTQLLNNSSTPWNP